MRYGHEMHVYEVHAHNMHSREIHVSLQKIPSHAWKLVLRPDNDSHPKVAENARAARKKSSSKVI